MGSQDVPVKEKRQEEVKGKSRVSERVGGRKREERKKNP